MQSRIRNRNLFAELNLTDDSFSKQQLLNNWTRPPPMEFHLLNSPALNEQLSYMTPQQPRSSSLPKYNLPQKTPTRGRKRERAKYRRWEQEIQFLEDFLTQFRQLHQSELLAYRQKLLLNYLSGFVDELKIECQEKAHFMSSVWNALIRIFQHVFDRVVTESKKVQKRLLNQEIKLHKDYQLKLEQLTKNNDYFKDEQIKSQKIMKQLIQTIASLNVQLKGTKNLHQKTVTTLNELVIRYEFIRTQHLELLMSGSDGMSRKEAEEQMRDCQTLSMARHTIKEKVKLKPKGNRKTRKINNKIDVSYLLEQLEAQEQFSYEITKQQTIDTAKTYVNEKIQTIEPQQKMYEEKGTLCGYYERKSLAMIQCKYSQTNLIDSKMFLDQLTQTEAFNFQDQLKLDIYNALSITIQKFTDSQTNPTEQIIQHHLQNIQQTELQQYSTSNIKKQNKSVASRKSLYLKTQQGVELVEENKTRKIRQSKMFRVGELRNLKHYNERKLKTEGGRQSSISPFSKTSSGKRVSQILLLQKLRQDIVKNFSRFRTSLSSNEEQKLSDFFQWFKQNLHKDFQGVNLIAKVIIAEQNFAEEHQNNRLSLCSMRNVQLSLTNAQIIQKIDNYPIMVKKKLGAGKCLRLVADLLHMGQKLTKEGVINLNMATFTMDYLAAIEGKCLSTDQKQKKFIEFIKACSPLTTSSYLVKNFFLLCGLPFNKLYRRSVTQKQKEDIRTEKGISKYMYTSEVYVYFKLLQKANCNQGDDLLEAYTRGEKLYSILDLLPHFYKGNRVLMEQAKNAVRMSIQQSEQKDPKLDIFKSLHMIIDQILQSKFRMVQQFEPLANLYGIPDRQFVSELIPLLTYDISSIPILLRLFRIAYSQGYTPENMATLAVIEGLQLFTHKFSIVEQDNKFTILKKLMHVQSGQNKLLMNMIKAIPNKQLKRPQFLLLLKILWFKQCDNLVEEMLGNDLMNFHCICLTHFMTRPNSQSYHAAIFRTQI